MTEGYLSDFRGTTNTFSIGSGSAVIGIPKSIVDDMKIDVHKTKTHFKVFYNKKKKEIIYKFIGEEEK